MVDRVRLKVFINKRTKQGSVVIPKKLFGRVPSFIDVKIKKQGVKR